MIFFRNRAADTEGTLADLVHQTAMYYEDRFKGAGFSRVILWAPRPAGATRPAKIDQIRRSLEDRLRHARGHRRSAGGRGADRSDRGGAGAARQPGAARRPAASRPRGVTA